MGQQELEQEAWYAELVGLIESTKWRHTSSPRYALIPHSYVMGFNAPRLCELLVMAIEQHGYNAMFGKREYRYINIGEYKYWSIPNPNDPKSIDRALNREPLKK